MEPHFQSLSAALLDFLALFKALLKRLKSMKCSRASRSHARGGRSAPACRPRTFLVDRPSKAPRGPHRRPPPRNPLLRRCLARNSSFSMASPVDEVGGPDKKRPFERRRSLRAASAIGPSAPNLQRRRATPAEMPETSLTNVKIKKKIESDSLNELKCLKCLESP